MWYVAAKPHRPDWVRVDRLLGEHGIQQDNAAGRQQFEQYMENDSAHQMDCRGGWSWALPKAPTQLYINGCKEMKTY